MQNKKDLPPFSFRVSRLSVWLRGWSRTLNSAASSCGRLHSCVQAEPKTIGHHVDQVTATQRFGVCGWSPIDGRRAFREQMSM